MIPEARRIFWIVIVGFLKKWCQGFLQLWKSQLQIFLPLPQVSHSQQLWKISSRFLPLIPSFFGLCPPEPYQHGALTPSIAPSKCCSSMTAVLVRQSPPGIKKKKATSLSGINRIMLYTLFSNLFFFPHTLSHGCVFTLVHSNLSFPFKLGTAPGNGWFIICLTYPLLPDGKNWLIGKDPDAGKDWSQEEKGMTEDEVVGWHHRLDGHEFE